MNLAGNYQRFLSPGFKPFNPLKLAEETDREAQTKTMFTRELERLFGVVKKRKREASKLFYVYEGIRLLEGGIS